MAGFRFATISTVLSTFSFVAVSTSTGAEDVHDTSFMQQFSIADFRAIPKQKFAEMAAGAAQCAVHGLGCGPQVDEFESLLQMPKVDAHNGVHKRIDEDASARSSGGRLRGGAGGRLRGAAGSNGAQKAEPVEVALNKNSAADRQGKLSTLQGISLAMDQNMQVGNLLRSAVQQEEEATREAAEGKVAQSTHHGILRQALERNAEARQALQSGGQAEEAKAAIFAALEQNAHLSYALRSAVQQEEASMLEAAKGHRVGAEHNGKLNHGFIYHAMQLNEKVSQALQSPVQGKETVAATVGSKQRKPTAQEAIYAAMEQREF